MSTANTSTAEEAVSMSSNAKPKAEKKKMNSNRKGIIVGVGVIAVLGALYMIYDSYMYVSTDNAMVQAQATLLSSRVSGIIIKSDIQENQKVKAGQVLAV